MIQTAMFKILVTVWIAGHPVQELLPQEYSSSNDKCAEAVQRIIDHANEGVKARAECVPAETRGL